MSKDKRKRLDRLQKLFKNKGYNGSILVNTKYRPQFHNDDPDLNYALDKGLIIRQRIGIRSMRVYEKKLANCRTYLTLTDLGYQILGLEKQNGSNV